MFSFCSRSPHWVGKTSLSPHIPQRALVTVAPDRSWSGATRFRVMWTTRQLLQFSIRLGLRRGLNLIRGARRTFTEDEQDKIADACLAAQARGAEQIDPCCDRRQI